MNPAPAHLESKLRFFWDLTVGQIAALFVGICSGSRGRSSCPVHGMAAAVSGVYIAALPVIPVFVASQTDFDLLAWWSARCAGGARGPLRARAPAGSRTATLLLERTETAAPATRRPGSRLRCGRTSR